MYFFSVNQTLVKDLSDFKLTLTEPAPDFQMPPLKKREGTNKQLVGRAMTPQLMRQLFSVSNEFRGYIWGSVTWTENLDKETDEAAVIEEDEAATSGAGAIPKASSKPKGTRRQSNLLMFLNFARMYYACDVKNPDSSVSSKELMGIDLILVDLPKGFRVPKQEADQAAFRFVRRVAVAALAGENAEEKALWNILQANYTQSGLDIIKEEADGITPASNAAKINTFVARLSTVLIPEVHTQLSRAQILGGVTTIILGLARKGSCKDAYKKRVEDQIKVATGLSIELEAQAIMYVGKLTTKMDQTAWSAYIRAVFAKWVTITSITANYPAALRLNLVARHPPWSFLTPLMCYMEARVAYSDFPWGTIEVFATQKEVNAVQAAMMIVRQDPYYGYGCGGSAVAASKYATLAYAGYRLLVVAGGHICLKDYRGFGKGNTKIRNKGQIDTLVSAYTLQPVGLNTPANQELLQMARETAQAINQVGGLFG